MTDQYRYSSGFGYSYKTTKMENEFSPKKTMIIVVIVVGCFAVLWPKVFYPMLVGSANQHIKPSAIDKTTGCCFVLSDSDVDTIKLMSELCGNIIKDQMGDVQLTGKQFIAICQEEVMKSCGIDISSVIQEQVRLGHSTKQILHEIRSLNGSLCLKYKFGVPPWRLGVPHLITLKNTSDSVRQERSAHVRSEMVHPAFRERGRAIPETGSPSRPPPRIIEGRPGPIPGMRPTMGGAGHVVSPSKQGSGSMGIIMPIYTIAIVIFFTYTLMKIMFKKHPDTDTIYSTIDQEGRYRKDMVEDTSTRGSRETTSRKLVVNAMSALLDEVDQEIEARRQASEVMQEDHTSIAALSNGGIKKEEKPSVKIMGMETSESCEGGKKWQSSNSSVLPAVPPVVNEHVNPPQEIFLERTLPPQSQILVSDSATRTEKNAEDDPAVVLAGKMTLSVISLENEDIEIEEIKIANNQDIVEKEIDHSKPLIEEEINKIIEEAIDNLPTDKFQEMPDSSNGKVDICDKVGLSENSNEHFEPREMAIEHDVITANDNPYALNCNDIMQQEMKDDIVLQYDEPEIYSINTNGGVVEFDHTLLLDSSTTSSNESGNTVLAVPLQDLAANVEKTVSESDNDNHNENKDESGEEDESGGEDESGEEDESEVEYEEVSEEEIEETEDHKNVDETDAKIDSAEAEIMQKVNSNGGAVLFNGADSNNDPENDESEEEIEEIIEEYSEEETDVSEDENHHFSSNGNEANPVR